MTHRFFARDGLPLNPYQELRNEPKASNPGVPQATEAELIGLQNLRNCSSFASDSPGSAGIEIQLTTHIIVSCAQPIKNLCAQLFLRIE
jgi:hypothetical protein